MGGQIKTARGAWWNTLDPGLTTKATGGLSMVSLDHIAGRRRSVTPLFASHPPHLSVPRRDGSMLGDTWVDPRNPNTWACLHGADAWAGHTICYHLSRQSLGELDDPMLYVGITGDIARRLTQHRCRKPWWPEVAEIMLTCFVNRETALAYESMSINVDGPVHNTQGRQRP
jgi:hypothetical protein